MYEEIEQEFPALSQEEISDAKVDPFTEILEGFEGEEGTLTEEQLADETLDATQTEGFSDTELQQLQELLEVQQTETTTSVAVDAEMFTQAIDDLAITLCSVILFAAFMVCGCMAAIKVFGGKFNGI